MIALMAVINVIATFDCIGNTESAENCTILNYSD